MHIAEGHFDEMSFCRHVILPNAKWRMPIDRNAFLPNVKMAKCLFVDMPKDRNVILPNVKRSKCYFAECYFTDMVRLG